MEGRSPCFIFQRTVFPEPNRQPTGPQRGQHAQPTVEAGLRLDLGGGCPGVWLPASLPAEAVPLARVLRRGPMRADWPAAAPMSKAHAKPGDTMLRRFKAVDLPSWSLESSWGGGLWTKDLLEKGYLERSRGSILGNVMSSLKKNVCM